MDVHPPPQPHQAPPDRHTPFRFPRSGHALRRLHAIRSVWQALHTWVQTTSAAQRWLPAGFRRPLAGYLLALLLAVGTASLTLLLVTLVPTLDLEGVLLLVGIVLVALTCGVGPSLLATGVGLLLLAGVVLLASHTVQQYSIDWGDLVVLLVSGLGLSLLAGALRAAKASSDQERQRLRALLEVLPVPVTMVDTAGRFLENTLANQPLWGDPAPLVRELAEVPAYPAWRPDTGQPVARDELPLARALTTGQSTLNEELAVEAVDGQRHILLNSATPMRDATGAMVGAVSVVQDMTERKRLEEALRQAEREAEARAGELEAIFEALTDGLLVLDAEGRILRANPAARGLLGFEAQPEFAALSLQERFSRYAPRDAEGQPIPPEHFAPARLLRGEVLTSAQAAEHCLEAPDGRERVLSVTGAPLHNAAGEMVGAVLIARDVTERRRLEWQVAERAAQLETIFESIADGVIVTDRQGRVLHMNQASRTFLGVELDPTGWTLPQLDRLAGFAGYSPAGQRLTAADDPIPRVLQGEVLTRQKSYDILVRTRAGRETQANITGAPIRDATGQLLGGVFVSRDVTEQRHLEQQTRDTLDALLAMAEALVQAPDQGSATGREAAPERHPVARRLAELTRQVLGCQQVSMVTVEPGTKAMWPITFVGLTPEQEQQWWTNLQEYPRMGQRLHPDVVAALETGESVLLERLQPPLPIWQHLTPGRPSWLVPMQIGETLVGLLRVDSTATGEADASANRRALLRAVARLGALVLERERLLREREEARASELALRETQAQMETFLGIAGHELKTPLTSILMGLQRSQRRLQRLLPSLAGAPGDAAAQVEAVQTLTATTLHQGGRLNRLVNDLLDISRIQAGQFEFMFTSADLTTIVRTAVEEQRQVTPERTIHLHLPEGAPLRVDADAERIGQVVTNYLTNALKYSGEAYPVEVGVHVEGQQGRVWVRDQGPGIPPGEHEHLFERFHRVPGIEVQSGSGVGLGLGLHISRTIIERHQGQVGVESAPGQGSTFWFIVPLARHETGEGQRT